MSGRALSYCSPIVELHIGWQGKAVLLDAARRAPVWIVLSDGNQHLEELGEVRLHAQYLVTTMEQGATPLSAIFVRAVYAIDEHHGSVGCPTSPYEAIEVFGVEESIVEAGLLDDLALGLQAGQGKFTMRKPASSASCGR